MALQSCLGRKTYTLLDYSTSSKAAFCFPIEFLNHTQGIKTELLTFINEREMLWGNYWGTFIILYLIYTLYRGRGDLGQYECVLHNTELHG